MFFFPVVGSNRATALANGVSEYNATRSCDADGLDGRCSIIQFGQVPADGRLVFRQYIRGLGISLLGSGRSEWCSGRVSVSETIPFGCAEERGDGDE